MKNKRLIVTGLFLAQMSAASADVIYKCIPTNDGQLVIEPSASLMRAKDKRMIYLKDGADDSAPIKFECNCISE